MVKRLIFFILPVLLSASVLSQQTNTNDNPGKPQYDQPYTKPVNKLIGESGNSGNGFDMAPETTPYIVAQAVHSVKTPLTKGPVEASWASLKANYHVPAWYAGAKFGLCMHWGIYSVPAYHNEWYEKHMYGTSSIAAWHVEHFGPQDKFGYKDFIPMFTAEHFDANAWAELFKKSGARFFAPACQHHDGFALWDSKVTPYNAVKMGPHRDLIGELAVAVRKQGLKFGFTNHEIENFTFINPPKEMLDRMKAEKADLFDPQWIDFYHVADRSDEACRKFLVDWYERNVELIDKYKPDILWFDNGIDQRFLDSIKLLLAAYYYNSANAWGKEVTLNSKKAAYAPSAVNTATIGSVLDFENKTPPGIRTGTWVVDTRIGSTWGYTEGMSVASVASIVYQLIDIVSKNGTMMLNLSPKADGTLPKDQQATLLGVGKWLERNGEAIYETHNWINFTEGGKTSPKINFTVKEDILYAIIQGKNIPEEIIITSLPRNAGEVQSVGLLGSNEKINFSQDSDGLKVRLPANLPGDIAWTLKISGLKMNKSTITASGNPIGY
ncbi:MAG: alpha-L-fucosidase [Bacteroidota bacterium]|nr:alpha-L-fucosidase [Bacteroidota bacterium]